MKDDIIEVDICDIEQFTRPYDEGNFNEEYAETLEELSFKKTFKQVGRHGGGVSGRIRGCFLGSFGAMIDGLLGIDNKTKRRQDKAKRKAAKKAQNDKDNGTVIIKQVECFDKDGRPLY